jgi:hypothetical protein
VNTLERLNELEARYDGPIPPHLLSPPGVHSLLTARANMRFYTCEVRFQIGCIQARRRLGLPVEDYMLRDLSLYWRQRRKYQAEADRLGRVRYVRAA